MEFKNFLLRVQNFPVVDTKILSTDLAESLSIKVQISRWVRSGKLIQLKRGIYLLAEPYRKLSASEFYIASVLKSPSYVSLEKALEYHGLIPEAVPVFTSVTTKRPTVFETTFGRYDYRHIQPSLFWGYGSLNFNGQTVFMATPEKALLDFFYLKHVKVSLDYLREMRLQNMDGFSQERLEEVAQRFNKPGLTRAVKWVGQYMRDEFKEVKYL